MHKQTTDKRGQRPAVNLFELRASSLSIYCGFLDLLTACNLCQAIGKKQKQSFIHIWRICELFLPLDLIFLVYPNTLSL